MPTSYMSNSPMSHNDVTIATAAGKVGVIAGGVIAGVGTALAPFTFGLSLGLVATGTSVMGAGAITRVGAVAAEKVRGESLTYDIQNAITDCSKTRDKFQQAFISVSPQISRYSRFFEESFGECCTEEVWEKTNELLRKCPSEKQIDQWISAQVPDAPEGVHGHAEDSTTIYLKWQISRANERNGLIQGYHVYYAHLYMEDNKQCFGATKVTNGTRNEATITGLLPDSQYQVTVAGYTMRGDGVRSCPLIIKTKANVPDAPEGVHGHAEDSTTVYLKWQISRANESNGLIQGYHVYYAHLYMEDNKQCFGATKVTNGTRNEATITGLLPDSQYQVTVAGYTMRGDGVRSCPLIIKTKANVPDAPEGVHVHAEDSTTVYLKWQISRANERNGLIQGYHVYYAHLYMEDNKQCFGATKVTNGTRNEATITGLLPDSQYQVTVAGYTMRGDGVRSCPLIIKTKSIVPDAPEFVQGHAKDLTTIYLKWQISRANERNGLIQGYHVYYAHLYMEDNKQCLGAKKVTNGTGNEATITGLLPDSQYQVTVAGYTMRSDGVESCPLIIKTKRIAWLHESYKDLKITERTVEMAEKIKELDSAGTIYRMRKYGKRICLIIGNMDFNGPSQLPGCKKDCLYAEALFKKLHFNVTVKENLTAKDMKNALKQKMVTDVDCFVCLMTSHGNQEGVVGCDGEVLQFREITELFDRDHCPQLEGKPKLFFFDVCRGSNIESPKFSNCTSRPPLKSDILEAYATSADYVSYCNDHHGSWFIRTLVNVIKENACSSDIYEMITKVTDTVGTFATADNRQQSATHTSSLRKQFFFYVPDKQDPVL